MRILIRSRRGVIRTDFGARLITAPLEAYVRGVLEEMFSQMAMYGSAFMQNGKLITAAEAAALR